MIKRLFRIIMHNYTKNAGKYYVKSLYGIESILSPCIPPSEVVIIKIIAPLSIVSEDEWGDLECL